MPDDEKLTKDQKVFGLLAVLIIFNVMLATSYFYEHHGTPKTVHTAPIHFIDTPFEFRPLIDWAVTLLGLLLVVGAILTIKNSVDDKTSPKNWVSRATGAWIICSLGIIGLFMLTFGSFGVFHPEDASEQASHYDTEGYDAYLGKNYEASAIAYQRAIDLNPDNKMYLTDAYFGIGRTFKSMNDKINARLALQQYLKVSQSDDGVEFMFVWLKESYDKQQQADRIQATEWLHELNSSQIR